MKLTCQSLNVGLSIRAAVTELLHDQLLFSDRRLPSRVLSGGLKLRRVVPRPNHAQKQIGPVVLHLAAEDLLLDGDRRGTLDGTKRLDRLAHAEIANTLHVRGRALVLVALLSVLDGHLRKANTDRTDIAAEDVTSIQGLARADGIVETLEVDCVTFMSAPG